MTVETGIHAVTSDDYHAGLTDEPSLSASIAKIILQQSPLHAWHKHPRLNPRHEQTYSDRFDLGTAAHALLLEGEKFAEKVATIDATDWRTKAAKEHKEACRAAGKIPLLTDDWQRVVEMVSAIRDQIAARDDDPPLFADGKPEQTIVWRDETTGVLCRARLDWLRDDFRAVDDLKSVTTARGSSNPHDWQRTFWGIGADIEARFHSRGVKTVTGVDPHFRFVVAESFPPYAVSVLDLAPSAIELADQKVDRALRLWKDCLERNEWPAYPGTASIEVSWQEADFLARHWQDDEEMAA